MAARRADRRATPVARRGVTLLERRTLPQPRPPPPMVTVAAPLERTINQWDDYVGRFEASRSVEVRPRVSGAIIGVHFTDGAIVRQGQLLFTIDPRPFAAALAEARAGVATAQSELALAETNLGRARRLLAEEAVSQSDVDRLTAAAQSARAALAAAQARVRSACAGCRVHPGPCTDRRPDFGSADRRRQSRLRRRRGRNAADHDQRARSDLFHLRRARIAFPEDCARAAGQGRGRRRRPRSGFRTRPTTAGAAGSTSPTMASTRLRARSEPGRSSPTRPISWRPACSATCAWPMAVRLRRC